MDINKKIKHKQWKDARYRKAERILRRIRQRIFDYEDQDAANGTNRFEKAKRVMDYLQTVLAPYYAACRHAAEVRKLQKNPSYFETS